MSISRITSTTGSRQNAWKALFGSDKISAQDNNDVEVTVQILHSDDIDIKYAYGQHIGTREYQQDSVNAGRGKGNLVYGIMCDGMGGLADGELASKTAAEALSLALENTESDCDIPELLSTIIHDINTLVFKLPSQDGQGGGAGTTLVATVVVDKNLYWLSVGDSRIYVIRGGEIVCVTRDHSYSMELDEQVRAGVISAEDAAADPQRNALISYLGMDRLSIIDCNRIPFTLESGDIILLCSDGLYRSLSDEDIYQIVTRHRGDAEECARALPLYAFDRSEGAQDNTSVVLLAIG